MNTYVCRSCGRPCYSAADWAHLLDKRCPHPDCRGGIVPEARYRRFAWAVVPAAIIGVPALLGVVCALLGCP